jgi:integrase
MHWRAIDPDIHIGYRKGARAGRWVVRWYRGEQAYRQATLATADDAVAADGIDVLSFSQVVVRAKSHVEKERAAEHASQEGPAPTVHHVISAYIVAREARERGNKRRNSRDARNRLKRHVTTSDLAIKRLHDLRPVDLRGWMEGLPRTLSASTVRRLMNDLKASLNYGGRHYRDQLPADFADVVREGLMTPPARSTPARRQVLADADIRQVIAAAWEIDREGGWDGDLARMVIVLAATGTRFSQAARMRVSDVQPEEGRLMVPVSQKGRGGKRVEHVAVRVGQDVIEALRPAITGRPGTSPLLERWRKRQVAGADWVRDNRAEWNSAAELRRPWAAIIARAGLPADTVPYALRHSSIVRNLRAHLPVRLVAAIHDTSSQMIEKHYAAYIVDALDDMAAKAVVPLISPSAEIVPLRSVEV